MDTPRSIFLTQSPLGLNSGENCSKELEPSQSFPRRLALQFRKIRTLPCPGSKVSCIKSHEAKDMLNDHLVPPYLALKIWLTVSNPRCIVAIQGDEKGHLS
eukprot:1133979-Amphidinium_carterae.1